MTTPEQKPGRSKQDYATPKAFLAAVMHYLDIQRFAFDFAADEHNAVAPHWFGITQDALRQPDWELFCTRGWGWLNPPYADIGPWAKRCKETRDHGGQIAFLVPAGVGSNWFRDYVDGVAKVLFLNGRLCFIPNWRELGFKQKPLYPKDCILCLYSPITAPDYEVWDWRKEISR